MKNLLALAVLLPLFAHTQITINTEDLPMAGDTVRYTNVFGLTIEELDLDLSGENMSWDYSWFDSEDQTVDDYLSVSDAPFLYQFFFNNDFLYPESFSNLATATDEFEIEGFSLENPYEFYNNGPEVYGVTGFGVTINDIPFSVPYDGWENINVFPMNYGDTDSSAFESYLEVPTLATWAQSGTRINQVDGWGTLTTPQGTFDVLRQKAVREVSDSVYVELFGFGTNLDRPTEIVYTWLAVGSIAPVLEIITQDIFGFETVTNVRYQEEYVENDISISELDWEVGVYPNPASEYITINTSSPTPLQVRIIDSRGREVWHGKVQTTQLIAVGDFARGNYLLEFSDGFQPQSAMRIVLN